MNNTFAKLFFFGFLSLVLLNGCSDTKVTPGDTKTFIKFFGGPYDNEAFDVNTIDDGFILAGRIQNVDGNGEASDYDFHVVRTDQFGNEKWSVTLGDSLDDEAKAIIQTSDGNFVAVGKIENSNTDHNIIIVKFDDNGNIIWNQQYGGDHVFYGGNDVCEASNGNLYSVGYSQRTVGSSKKMHFIEFDASGNLTDSSSLGSNQREDIAHQIYENGNGNLVVSGTMGSAEAIVQGSTGTTQFGAIIIITTSLTPIDGRAIGGGSGATEAYASVNVNDSVYYLIGTTNSLSPNFGGKDAYLAKFTKVAGSLSDSAWTVKYGLGTDDGLNDIITRDGNLYIAGYRGGESMLIKTDLDGRTKLVDCNSNEPDITENSFCHLNSSNSNDDDNLWFRTFGSIAQQMEGKVNSVTSSLDNGFIMAGSSRFASTTMMSLTKTNDQGQVGE